MLDKITYYTDYSMYKDIRLKEEGYNHGWKTERFYKMSCFVDKDYDESLLQGPLNDIFVREVKSQGFGFLSLTPEDRIMIYDRDGLESKLNYEYTFWVRKLSEEEIIQDRLGDICE